MEIEMTKQFNYDDLPVIQTKQGKIRGYQSGEPIFLKGLYMLELRDFKNRKNLNVGMVLRKPLLMVM